MTKRYPVKTLQRELLTFVVKQLTYLIFPPTRVHHNKQNHLIKRVKRFQDGKWEELWKQSLPQIWSSGHTGDTRSGQTGKKPKDLSVREREECGCGKGPKGGGVYVVCM